MIIFKFRMMFVDWKVLQLAIRLWLIRHALPNGPTVVDHRGTAAVCERGYAHSVDSAKTTVAEFVPCFLVV